MIEIDKEYGGLIAIGFIFIRAFFMLRNRDIDRIEKNQRAKWQAEFFDRNHGDYKELRNEIDSVKDDYYKMRLIVARLQDRVNQKQD